MITHMRPRLNREGLLPKSKSIQKARVILTLGCFLTAAQAGVPTFNKDVRPILSDNCLGCHGMDAKHRKADLRLDTAEGAQAVNKDGLAAIVPGDLAKSEAWQRILSTDPDSIMPPPESHKELTAAQKETLKQWIAAGAKYENHWAFEPVVKPEKEGTGATAIDFLLQKDLAAKEWTPLLTAQEADRGALIRRVSFALTGLPPKWEDVAAFQADAAPDAYERMVDRYLASTAYGEEMARHWLDVARYGDTHGLHLDNERHTWAYRDWVVDAFNRNLPYDAFTLQQLAGDLMPDATDDMLVATGFNRCNTTTSEGGAIAEEWIFRYAVDRASTTAQAWLGLTAGCAACHDHKYDPISQKEFYQLYAFFFSNADPAMDGNATNTAPVLQIMTPEQKKEVAEWGPKLEAIRKTLSTLASKLNYQDPADQTPAPAAQVTEKSWFDDQFPAGAVVEGEQTYSNAEAGSTDPKPHAGTRSLKLSGQGIVQTHYSSGAAPLDLPAGGVLSFRVWLPEKNPARQVMVQFNTGDWNHRATWGADVIPWGEAGKPSRKLMGKLPAAGAWQKLEVPFASLGLAPGTKINGFALTIETGTAYFDSVEVRGEVDPTKEADLSFKAWQVAARAAKGKGLPDSLKQLATREPGKISEINLQKLRAYYVAEVWKSPDPALLAARKELKEVEGRTKEIEKNAPVTFIYKDLAKPRQAHVMARGQYNAPGEPVEPNAPAFLPKLELPAGKTRADRLDLAKWLVSPQNPLTARVTVNRFWQQLFGNGLVKSSHDFGVMGDMPSNGPLLDYLAVHFQSTGWDVKRLLKAMVCSQAFRRSSIVTPAQLERDPENRFFLRGPRLRLDGEQLRDNALAVSGLLSSVVGGRGVNPYQPANIWEPVGFGGSNTRFYKQDTGEKLYRRSLYTFFKRTAPHPMFTNFDAPNREQFCSRRERSNTPLQALQLMNDVQHYEAARMLAERVLKSGGQAFPTRLQWLFRSVLARDPLAEESATLTEYFTQQLAKYEASPEEAKKALSNGETKADASLPAAQVAAWALLSNLVLNLDETVTRN